MSRRRPKRYENSRSRQDEPKTPRSPLPTTVLSLWGVAPSENELIDNFLGSFYVFPNIGKEDEIDQALKAPGAKRYRVEITIREAPDLGISCPYCGRPAERVNGTRIYPKRRDLADQLFFLCATCNAYVGCHPDGTPFGSLANAALRAARRLTHERLTELQEANGASTTELYKWMAQRLDLPRESCHIGMFDLDLCEKAGRAIEEELSHYESHRMREEYEEEETVPDLLLHPPAPFTREILSTWPFVRLHYVAVKLGLNPNRPLDAAGLIDYILDKNNRPKPTGHADDTIGRLIELRQKLTPKTEEDT